MRKFALLPAALLLAAALRELAAWSAGPGAASASDWMPALYFGSIAGMIFFSLLALGTRSARGTLEAAAAVMFFQGLAACACASRQGGHAMAAMSLFLAAAWPAILPAALCRPDKGAGEKLLRLAAFLVLAGLPPLPGFFARIDLLSLAVHASLPWLAIWIAGTQAAVAVALIRVVFRENLFEFAEPADGLEKGRAAG